MEDINSGALDSLLALDDDINDLGDSDVDAISLLQQLIITSLKASMDAFDVAMNKMKKQICRPR